MTQEKCLNRHIRFDVKSPIQQGLLSKGYEVDSSDPPRGSEHDPR